MIIHILNYFLSVIFLVEVQTKYSVLSFENVALLKSYLVFDDLSGKSSTIFLF